MRLFIAGGMLVAWATLGAASSVAETVTSAVSDPEAGHAADPIEEVLVVGPKDTRSIELVETLGLSPDSGVLLKKTVGANLLSNGPLTGIAQYRGMSRMRISSRIDGAVISPGGPNWMDAPLSYAPAATVETLEVFRGIAPVSAGQETIGGVVNASNWHGSFSDDGVALEGRVRTGARSVDEGTLVSAGFSLANENHRLNASGFTEEADNAEFSNGSIRPSHYQRDRYDVGYGFRSGASTVEMSFGRNNTGDAGTPALPMDIQFIDADLYGLAHRYEGSRWQLRSKFYYNDINHGMTNYQLRAAPMDPGMYRRNLADGKNLGFTTLAAFAGWQFGADLHRARHDSNIDNPNNPMFFVDNFNDAQRDSFGVFVERELRVADNWLLELGLRYNRIETNAGVVNATPAVIGMPPAVALRDTFNAADRSITDDNIDWVAKTTYLVNGELSYYAGIARKTRSPAYQERYLWLPLQSTAGLADGQTYTGNIDLDVEVAHEVEIGLDWQWQAFSLSPRLFYRYVDDYIQGTASTNTAAVMFVRMMNMMNGTDNPDPLEFNNVDARFYGFDLDWRYQLNERWSLSGVVNYVRGEREDNADNLYRIPPLNGFIAMDYQRALWGLTLEAFGYADQNEVAAINQETKSDGYLLFNASGHWNFHPAARLAVGIDNLTDNNYVDHLGGVNRVMGNPDIAVGERLPGYGRNFFARLDLAF